MARRTERDVALLPERGAEPLVDQLDQLGTQPGSKRRRTTSAAVTSEHRLNFHPLLDHLPEEQPLTIEVNGRPVVALICSPIALRELAVGWVFARGLIGGASDIGRISEFPGRVSIMVDDATELPTFDASLSRVYSADHGLQANSSVPLAPLVEPEIDPAERTGWTIDRDRFLDITESIFARLHTDRAASVNHYAAATDGGGVSIAARDLSRQNAIDKVIGWTVLQDRDRSGLMLCVTGQMNAAALSAVWRAGFPLIASTCEPTADAVDIAETAGITIVGRVLQPERAVYSHGWRLPVAEEDGSVAAADGSD